MAEFDSAIHTPFEMHRCTPKAATLKITLEDHQGNQWTDTVELSPFWSAKLLKLLRGNISNSISLLGSLPPNSLEPPLPCRESFCRQAYHSPHEWQGWLHGKPPVQFQ